jgi:hypothetical protein
MPNPNDKLKIIAVDPTVESEYALGEAAREKKR